MRRPFRLLLLPLALVMGGSVLAGPAGATPPRDYPVPAPVDHYVDEAKLPFDPPRQRTGGERPLAEAGFAAFGDFLFTAHPQFPGYGEEGRTKSVPGNAGTVYQFDADPTLTPADEQLNAGIFRVQAGKGSHGLSGVPAIDGTFDVPVLSLHGLGDLFVPFSMEQIYARDAAANGRPDLLVQRAIRSVGHCDSTPAERNQAFTDLVNWVENGVKPAGDDVLTPAVVADRSYGCRFTSGPHGGDAEYAARCTAR